MPLLIQEGFVKSRKKNQKNKPPGICSSYCPFLLALAFLSIAWIWVGRRWCRSPCSFTHQMVGALPENKQKGLDCSAERPQEALQPLDEVPPLYFCLTWMLALLFGIVLNKPTLLENDSPSAWHQVTWGLFIFPRSKHFTPCLMRTRGEVQISSLLCRFSSRPIFPCSC